VNNLTGKSALKDSALKLLVRFATKDK